MAGNEGSGRDMRPRWVAVMAIACALPVLAMPTLMGMMQNQGMNLTLLKLYPVYVLGSSWCAWQVWPQRPALTWVLLALTLLSHAAIWGLAVQ